MKLRSAVALSVALAAPVLLVRAQQQKPKPAATKTTPAGKLAVEAGPVVLRKKAAAAGGKAAKQVEKKIVKGLTADLETRETAVVGDEGKAVAKFGGCVVNMMQHTTLEVVEVGEEVSVVEILGVELELTRGTQLDAEFGSLKVNLHTGSFKATPTPGVITTLRIVTSSGKTLNFSLKPGAKVNLVRRPGGQLVVSVPPGSPDVTMTVTSTDASGNEVTSSPSTFTSGTSSDAGAVVGSQVLFLATEQQGPSGNSSPTTIVQEASASATLSQPPDGTVVGSLPLSTGLGK